MRLPPGSGRIIFAAIDTILTKAGLPSRFKPTPTVSAFLRDNYVVEKQLDADANRHAIGYLTLFARATGDKALAEYNRGDLVRWLSRRPGELARSRITPEGRGTIQG